MAGGVAIVATAVNIGETCAVVIDVGALVDVGTVVVAADVVGVVVVCCVSVVDVVDVSIAVAVKLITVNTHIKCDLWIYSGYLFHTAAWFR